MPYVLNKTGTATYVTTGRGLDFIELCDDPEPDSELRIRMVDSKCKICPTCRAQNLLDDVKCYDCGRRI